MSEKRKFDVLVFSGTNNTKMIMQKITGILSEQGMDVQYHSTGERYVHEKGREVLLAFPINSQSVSPYIWKYIKGLPNGCNDKIHVVITMNESAAIIKPLEKVLRKKEYQPVGVKEISMPNNMLIGTDTLQRLEPAMQEAEQFAEAILNNSETFIECKKGSSFVSFLSRETVLPWVTMRLINKLETNQEKCTKCGLCVRECPVQNIQMEDFPTHKNKCEFCMHCAAICPNKSVCFKGKPGLQVRNMENCGK